MDLVTASLLFVHFFMFLFLFLSRDSDVAG